MISTRKATSFLKVMECVFLLLFIFWLNGHKLGYHMYGYTGFEMDMTHYLKLVLRIQSTHETGTIRVKVTVEGLPQPYYLDIPVKGHP